MVYAYSLSDESKYVDTNRIDPSPRLPVGTCLRNDKGAYHYGCAGEDLSPRVLVESDLSEEDKCTLAFSQKMEKFADIVYGRVVAVIGDPRAKPGVLGWPEVQVKKGYYFWIREIPLGSTLVPEEGEYMNKAVKE